MFDYMKKLQQTFSEEPEYPDLQSEMERLHQELIALLGKSGNRKLLMLLNTMDEQRDRLALSNFIEGFRLAAGIAKELSMTEPYSFDRAEETRGGTT